MKRVCACLAMATALFFLAVIPFAQSACFGLAPCDDYCYVQQKSEVRNGLSATGASWAFQHVGDGIWMPGTWLSYQFDWTMFNGKPTAFHLHSLVVHGLNTVLLWWLFLLLIPATNKSRFFLAGIAALLWAMHPLRAESVVWIASRKDVLSMFWLLLSLISWVWGRKRQGGKAALGYAGSLIFICLGAMCKPSVNVYPLLVVLLDWLVLGTLRIGKREKNTAIPFWLIYVLPLFIGVAVTLEGAWAQYAAGGFVTQQLPLYGRILNCVAAFGLYVWNTICPINLAVDCVQKWPHLPRGLFYGVLFVILTAWYFLSKWERLRKEGWQVKTPAWFLLGATWFCGTLLPFLTAFGIHAQADRFTYIPSIGLCFIIIGGWEWWQKLKNTKAAQLCWGGLHVLIILSLALLSWRQTSFWQDERKLYEHTLQVDGEDNYRAQILLGIHSWNVDYDLDAAIHHIGVAHKLNPESIEDFKHIYMFVLTESNRMKEAEELLHEMMKQWELRKQQKSARGDVAVSDELPRYLLLARAAYFIANPELRSMAEPELARIERKGPHYRLLYYLKGRLAWVQGDTSTARQYWRNMLVKGSGEEYLRCSFVERFL